MTTPTHINSIQLIKADMKSSFKKKIFLFILLFTIIAAILSVLFIKIKEYDNNKQNIEYNKVLTGTREVRRSSSDEILSFLLRYTTPANFSRDEKMLISEAHEFHNKCNTAINFTEGEMLKRCDLSLAFMATRRQGTECKVGKLNFLDKRIIQIIPQIRSEARNDFHDIKSLICAGNNGDDAAIVMLFLLSQIKETQSGAGCLLNLRQALNTNIIYNDKIDKCESNYIGTVVSNKILNFIRTNFPSEYIFDAYKNKYSNIFSTLSHDNFQVPASCTNLMGLQLLNNECGLPEMWLIIYSLNNSSQIELTQTQILNIKKIFLAETGFNIDYALEDISNDIQ